MKELSDMRRKEEQIIKDTDKYNQAAECYFQKRKDDPWLKQKPISIGFDALHCQARFVHLISALDISQADTVLDFGAGTCWVSALLNRMGVKTISLDVSKTALEVGKEIFQLDKRQRMDLNPEFIVYDGHKFPLPDGSVDRIICFDAFHHIPNQQDILNEMCRVLREGGKVGFSEPAKFELGAFHSISKDAIAESETYGILENDIYLPDLRKKAESAGFTGFFIKPLLRIDCPNFELNEYPAILENMDRLSAYLDCCSIIFEKGKEKADSKHPRTLKAEIKIMHAVRKVKAGEVLNTAVKIKNTGDTLWISKPQGSPGVVALGFRLMHHKEKINEYREYLKYDIPPGGEDKITVSFAAPYKKGDYLLEFDMVDEHICWFQEKSGKLAIVNIKVA